MAESYETYLQALRSQLTTSCGAEKANTILAEARAHLEEGIDELMSQGQSRAMAEQEIMNRFGDAKAVCAWYSDQHRRPSVWRASRGPLAFLGCYLAVGLFLHYYLRIVYMNPYMPAIENYAWLAVAILVCYRSKRFTSGVMAIAASGVFVVVLAALCLFSIPIHGVTGDWIIARSSIPSEVAEAKARLKFDESVLPILRAGTAAFQSSKEPASGVGPFHDARGYLTPEYYLAEAPGVREPVAESMRTTIRPTYFEARIYWEQKQNRLTQSTCKLEKFEISLITDGIADTRSLLSTLPKADSITLAQKLPFFLHGATFPALSFLVFALKADIIGGILRLVFARIRKRKPISPVAT